MSTYKKMNILVCSGAGCISSGCKDVYQTLHEHIGNQGLLEEVRVTQTGCMGPCDMGPVIIVYPDGVFYRRVKTEDVLEIVVEHVLKGRVVQRLTYRSPETGDYLTSQQDINFFKQQTRVALRNCGQINPERIEEYINNKGYCALGKALKDMKPQEVIQAVKDAGLRGRGGAGFSTGMKWQFSAGAPGPVKYVVCNADEGDPGAFMDRSILEGDPHSVLEAMAICGYAVGAQKGYVYVRAEYPLAVERLGIAIDQARRFGMLGENIFGAGFSFDVEIRVGAGAFVCGEETALLASIEGRRGEPRPRPPFPAVQGLYGKPTVINNVETWACIPPILLQGPEWFASLGTEKSKGTKVFALAGKVVNTGLIEVPMGTPLGEIIFDIGGGVPHGKHFKAVQTGGPSGGCVPARYLNTPADYESLSGLGTIMGSGGMIVMDEDTCMVDLAKYFLEFVQDESCGKCVPCRVGAKRMLELLERITRGEGQPGDIELLEELCHGIKSLSLCGLGQTAPNPVLSTLRYFRKEYEEHIYHKHCPSSVCAGLFISPCQNTCPANVDVPIYIDRIRNQDFAGAYQIIKRENPFPVVCGRVCHSPCETRCRRGLLDEPLAIRRLKKYAADYGVTHQDEITYTKSKDNGKRVSIIGAGPAGLTAAYYLRRKGYQTTVYDAAPVPGGMMALGIPDFRLPKGPLFAEVNDIANLGVKIVLNTKVGKDIPFEQVRSASDAVFIAVGAQHDHKLNIPGEDLKGYMSGVDFLRDVNLGRFPAISGKSVTLVGGGNVTIDAARCAVRLGASEVNIYYRRTRQHMPAMEEEIEQALAEGVRINYLVSPTEILGENGAVTGMVLQPMKLGPFGDMGRRRSVPLDEPPSTVKCDLVIVSISRSAEVGFVDGLEEVLRSSKVAKDTSTGIEGIFTGGDCVLGPATVVEAIAAGKSAAVAIDRYLGGTGQIVEPLDVERKYTGPVIEEERSRMRAPTLPPEARIENFTEVEQTYSKEAAVYEAQRCLRCDVRD
ncbi:MAG: NADH-ubiquinone oxidoreductase-F iron-sulfur binding region domain-containing protein [Bacillota bacterium]